MSVVTHDANSVYITSLLKLCNAIDYVGVSENIGCRLFMGDKNTKKDADNISKNVYNFSLISADRAYKNKYSKIDTDAVNVNFITQVYRRNIYILAAPHSHIKTVKDLKGKKVLVSNTDFVKALANILNANGIGLHQIKVLSDTVEKNGQNRCLRKDIDAIFYEGPVKDSSVIDFIWACGYKIIPVQLTKELHDLYPYYRSTRIFPGKLNNGKGYASISVPIVALSSTDTSFMIVGAFLTTFFNQAIALDKVFQTIGGQAVDYMKNVTTLPLHPAAFVVKQKLLEGNN